MFIDFYIYNMRNNSLRQQIGWHAKQQTYLFKKINKDVFQDDHQFDRSNTDQLKQKNNNVQNSELQWLEKIVGDIKDYKKNSNSNQIKIKDKEKYGQTVDHSIQCLKERKSNQLSKKIQRKSYEKNRDRSERQTNRSNILKFQVIRQSKNKENNGSSVKKYATISHNNVKSNKTIPTSTNNQKNAKKITYKTNASPKNTPALSRQYKKICNLEQNQFLNMSIIQTDPNQKKMAYINNRISNQNLWSCPNSLQKKNSNQNGSKSIGKIIKNLKSALNDTKKDEKKINTQQSIPRQKVFLKLETEKLQQCLKRQDKTDKLSKSIEVQMYSKYCTTDRDLKDLRNQQNDKTHHKVLSSVQVKQPKNVKIQQKIQRPPWEIQTIMQLKQLARQYKPAITSQSYLQKPEQRRFNTSVQRYTKGSLFNPKTTSLDKRQQNKSQLIKQQQKSILQNNNLTSFLKLKRQYCYHDQQSNFHQRYQSVDKISCRRLENNQINKNVKQADHSRNNIQMWQNRKNLMKNQQSCVNNPLTNNKKQQTLNNHSRQYSFSEETGKSNRQGKELSSNRFPFTDQLTMLFDYLDQAKRGFLTDTNCGVDNLTSELKILFSAILHQVKTKKRFYNLQNFINESHEVLKVKSQIYLTTRRNLEEKSIGNIIKENLEILKKKHPLLFLKHTHTQSYFQTNFNSKRPSTASNQSIVLEKLIQKSQLKHTFNEQIRSINRKFTYQTEYKILDGQINEEEPEKYFEKKYGFKANQIQTKKSNEVILDRKDRERFLYEKQ